MSLPRVAVAGSCVTRDPFNRILTPDYKTKVDLTETIYQSSLPSLINEEIVDVGMPQSLRPNFVGVVEREYTGRNLGRLATSHSDIVLVDFFADVHFGVTRMDGRYVTRNHMAFMTLNDADVFYNDDDKVAPNRMRFEAGDSVQSKSYRDLASESIKRFVDTIKSQSPDTILVLNSARLATTYQQKNGQTAEFNNKPRFLEKNRNWAEIDEMFEDLSGCERINHPESLFVGSESHPWGLHPVHYTAPYYAHFWKSLERIIEKKSLK
jgi:hypothetical protein